MPTYSPHKLVESLGVRSMRLWMGLTTLAAVVLAGAIYGWGLGLFYPCGPLDRFTHTSDCRILATFDATQLQTLIKLPDGLLSVARGDGQEPTMPQRLVEVAIADGSTRSETAIEGVPSKASWMDAALSPAGTQLGAALFDEKAAIIDRASGKVTAQIPLYTVALIGFDGEDRVLIDRGISSSERPPEVAAEVFSARDGSQLGTMTDGAARLIYARGVAQALSPDGTMLAQQVETRGDSGIVAIRLADAAFQSWSGRLLTAPLAAWSTQILPWLWFSPDGRYLAASFDSAPVWGKDTSALMIWDTQSEELIQRIPTHAGELENLVWLDDGRVAATRFDTNSRRGEIITIEIPSR